MRVGAGPENTPCDAKAKTLLAPNSLRTSAALHRVPAVSTISSTAEGERGRRGREEGILCQMSV
jgi:hypothetical protein